MVLTLNVISTLIISLLTLNAIISMNVVVLTLNHAALTSMNVNLNLNITFVPRAVPNTVYLGGVNQVDLPDFFTMSHFTRKYFHTNIEISLAQTFY